MSLEQVIVVAGDTPYTSERRGSRSAAGRCVDRSLPPRTPKTFEAKAAPDSEGALGFLWYRQYTFAATRGRGRRVRLRYVDGPVLSAWRFRVESVLFRWKVTQSLLVDRVA